MDFHGKKNEYQKDQSKRNSRYRNIRNLYGGGSVLLYLYTRRAIKWTIPIIIEECYYYRLHRKFYPAFFFQG
jgi:hypothetical protein